MRGTMLRNFGTVALVSLSLLCGLSASAQGILRFENCCAPGTQVIGPDGAPLDDPGYIGEFLAGPDDALVRVATSTFRTGAAAGCWVTLTETLPGFAPGTTVNAQARVWDTRGGTVTSWEQVLADCTIPRGVSEMMTFVLGDPLMPPTTACFASFVVQPACCDCSHVVSLAPGWNLVGNACHDPNPIGALMPNPPLGTLVLSWDNSSSAWRLNVYATAFAPGWWDSSRTVAPGEGVYIFNPGSSAFSITFCGNTTTPSLPLPWSRGCFLACRQIGAPAGFLGITGYPPTGATSVYEFDPASGWAIFTYDDLLMDWLPTEPTPAEGKPVWVCLGGSAPGSFPDVCSYTISIPPCGKLMANQCSNDNRITTLLPGLPIGTHLWKFRNSDHTWSFNEFTTGWSNPSQTLAPGEGAMLSNPSGAAFDVVIAGWANTPVLPLPYCSSSGLFLVSGQSPAPASYEDIMGCVASDGALLYRYNPTMCAYSVYTYFFGEWDPLGTHADVGESVWVSPLGSGGGPPTDCPLSVSFDASAMTVTLCWPCEGCHLEQSPSLAPGSWTTVAGSFPCVELPLSGGSQFFRVACP